MLADEEPARVRQRVVRALGRAVGHEEVPDERRGRAAEPEQRGAARIALGGAGDEGEHEPRSREQAHVGRPADAPDVAGAEVLVARAEGGGGEERERDHHRCGG